MRTFGTKSWTTPSAHAACRPAGTGLHGPVWAPRAEIDVTLRSLMRILALRDPHTARHSERLAGTAFSLGSALALDSESLFSLYVGGFLHDIGKIAVPDEVLLKPGRLTAPEWTIMRAHAEGGEALCQPMPSLRRFLPLIRSHHERWDGSGYPDGLSGERIPLLARVIHVADIYDALTHPRSYKPAYSSPDAIAILRQETDRGWHDPKIVTEFIRFQERTAGPDSAPVPEPEWLPAIAS
jgi:putative two-component system response regulator